jgi:hypothetical protein
MHQILRVRNLGHLWKQQQAQRIFRAFPTLLLQWKNRSPAQHAYVVHPAESKRTPPATPFYYFGYAKGLLSVFRGDGQCGAFLLSTGWGMHAECYLGWSYVFDLWNVLIYVSLHVREFHSFTLSRKTLVAL